MSCSLTDNIDNSLLLLYNISGQCICDIMMLMLSVGCVNAVLCFFLQAVVAEVGQLRKRCSVLAGRARLAGRSSAPYINTTIKMAP